MRKFEKSGVRTTSQDASVSPARKAAFEILMRVATVSSYAAELLNGPLTAELDERDAGLCTELVLGTLRWQATLDFLAQRHVTKWESFDPEVQTALRLGIYQLRFLCSSDGRMPVRAAIFETVEMVKAARKRSAAGLVNAVMRKVAQQGAGQPLSAFRTPGLPDVRWLAVETSTPDWMLERWIGEFGRDAAVQLAMACNQTPRQFVRLNSTATRSEEKIEEELSREGITLLPSGLLKGCRVVASGNLSRSTALSRGDVVFQDEASQLVPLLLDVKDGDRVLDLCAAPGNKTVQLGTKSGARGLVIACDLYPHRLVKFAAIPETTRIERLALDGTVSLPLRACFDRILVDAPCSGTGTLRRNPEIKWKLSPGDISLLAERQLSLLKCAAEVLLPGGRLVYSVCSLEREEGPQVIQRFLDSNSAFRVVPLRDDRPRLSAEFHSAALPLLDSEFLATTPQAQGTDGFFAAILEKGKSGPEAV